ncbi:hypothetical protein M153_3330004033 [Pseudoloma neurophilia]|uniref:Integrase catalytic domain-containing protein n=1 Tax=Pseudoloma neurophilia TaxID=146866 RepID=A0A0R0M467_9MICR|nr:hypothetical protein M153_3330004033 [Pseudoloma neurophilia]
MDIKKKYKAVIGIDYFSRKVFGSLLRSKSVKGILSFLKETFIKFPFKTLQSDGGREFLNSTITKWCRDNKVKHKVVTPHYHQ